MKVWVLYSTDGDSGWYNVEIYQTKKLAELARIKRNDAYSKISEMEIKD